MRAEKSEVTGSAQNSASVPVGRHEVCSVQVRGPEPGRMAAPLARAPAIMPVASLSQTHPTESTGQIFLYPGTFQKLATERRAAGAQVFLGAIARKCL